ncbi:MAG: hypothetical protein LC130_33465, partial [Bryobacterales bacterium]|nr:hypothetical protein [Bryobacterales bacterium]
HAGIVSPDMEERNRTALKVKESGHLKNTFVFTSTGLFKIRPPKTILIRIFYCVYHFENNPRKAVLRQSDPPYHIP